MDALKEVATRLRQAAHMDAKEKIDAASTVLAGKLAVAAAELDSAILDCEEVEAKLKDTMHQRDQLAQERTEIATLNTQLRQQVSDAQARASAAEMREGELRQHSENLKSELATSHRMHDEERDRSNQARNEVARMRVDLDANVLVLSNAVGDANHARELAAESKERIETVEAEREQARREAKENGELAAGLQRELAAVKQKSDDFYALIKGEKSRIGKSTGKRAKTNVN